MSASNSEYEQYGFSQELVNIDAKVEEIDAQLNAAIGEIQKLVKISVELKQHQSMYKQVWKKHNVDKFSEILMKSKQLDNLLRENF